MIVRSHLPWPLRWAVFALALGFSAALALWAFEFGKDIAGLDRNAKEELTRLREEVSRLRQDTQQARAIADTAGSLVKAERVAQERLAQQVRQLEGDKLALQADLGFFERLLPVAGEGLQLRGLQAEPKAPGQVRYQMLLMQSGKSTGDFSGRYEVTVAGSLDGKPWSQAMAGGAKLIQFKQYLRVEGLIDHPAEAVLKTLQARILDSQGVVRATQTARF